MDNFLSHLFLIMSYESEKYKQYVARQDEHKFKTLKDTKDIIERARGGGLTWNDFEAAHKHMGLSKSDMSTAYQAHKAASSNSSGGNHESKPRTVAYQKDSSWNDFEAAHKHMGLSKSEYLLSCPKSS